MAERLAAYKKSHPDHLVYHLTGAVHSGGYLGTVEQLHRRRPDLDIQVITAVFAEPSETEARQAGTLHQDEGDYIVVVPKKRRAMGDEALFILLPFVRPAPGRRRHRFRLVGRFGDPLPMVVRHILDVILPSGDLEALLRSALGLLGLYVLCLLLTFSSYDCGRNMGARIEHDLRCDLFAHGGS